MAMVCIYRNQDELESQQTTLLGRMVFFLSNSGNSHYFFSKVLLYFHFFSTNQRAGKRIGESNVAAQHGEKKNVIIRG